MKIAVISDVHGNHAALEAVLSHIAQQRPDLIVNLGDTVSGPLQPFATAKRLMDLALLSVCGNHERQLLTLSPDQMGSSDHFAAQNLSPEQRAWMATLPETLLIGDDVLLVHGTPDSDLTYFLETLEDGICRPATRDEATRRAGQVSASLILCGHTHIPRVMHLEDGRLIVNPGSVGLQAFNDDHPFPHTMAAGSPHARYAVVERCADGWRVEMMVVEYDWDAAAILAERHGRSDWAQALRTGRL
jgi:putative phosphoesterase